MEENVIAVVAGQKITEDDFIEFLQELPEQQRAYLTNPAAADYFKDEMITIYLYEKYGEELGLDQSELYEKRMKRARRSILGQMAMEKALSNVTVSDEEAHAFFDGHKCKFMPAPTVSAKHILMDDETAIKKVLADIESGAQTFEDAAKNHSTCPSGKEGGDLGTFGKGQMVKEFEEAAFAAEIGKIVGPVQTQFGYHLIKVESKSESEMPNYEDVADQVKTEALRRKQQDIYSQKAAELKAKYCE